jgi:hypothetical protein
MRTMSAHLGTLQVADTVQSRSLDETGVVRWITNDARMAKVNFGDADYWLPVEDLRRI